MDGTEKTPRQITRAAYLDMIKAAGFDVDDTFSLRFATDGIYARWSPATRRPGNEWWTPPPRRLSRLRSRGTRST